MMLRCTAKALAQMVRLHACGKSEGLERKVGHATVRADSRRNWSG